MRLWLIPCIAITVLHLGLTVDVDLQEAIHGVPIAVCVGYVAVCLLGGVRPREVGPQRGSGGAAGGAGTDLRRRSSSIRS